MRRTLVAIAAALVLSGCYSAPCTQPCASVAPLPSPITTPIAGFDLLVTDHDRAITAHTGQKILVALTQRSGMTRWEGIRVDDGTVLGPQPINFMAPRGVTVAGFVALKPGTANITATAGPLCSPGQPCPQYAMLFSVTVTVT